MGSDGDDDPVDVDPEMFERAVLALENAEATMEELSDEMASIDTGLTHSDTVALLYGRRNSLNKTEVQDALDALEDASNMGTRSLVRRMLADQSDLTLKQADAFVGELERLERRYGGDDG